MQKKMQNLFRLVICGGVLLSLLIFSLFCEAARADEMDFSSVIAHMDVHRGTAEVRVKWIQNENWLFLPAFVRGNEQVKLFDENGCELTWKLAATDDDSELWHVSGSDQGSFDLHVMRSQHLRSVFLFSDDPENRGREYIEDCEGHSRKAKGSIGIVDVEGNVDYTGELREIRGRGNSTWGHLKKPYQIKLEEKNDLLKTGDPAEANRTWVLLADATDTTLLHNRIALDLGLELGMEETSHSESVDLYYDGDYRGTYLLTEKVQINEGRIDVPDYEKLIKEWNQSVGQKDLSQLSVAEATNRFGNRYTYIEGLQTVGEPNVGSYQIEAERGIDERCYFCLTDDEMRYSIKSPEYASREMVEFISERLQEAQQTVKNGGVNPQTGRTLEEDFNVDTFACMALLTEFTYNVDAFSYASTWFVLPAGETRFESGPLWDADLSMHYLLDEGNAQGVGLKDRGLQGHSWLIDFYGCESFVRAMQRIYQEELYPLIQNVLLGEQQGTYLKSLSTYVEETEASAKMNGKIWNTAREGRFLYGDTYEEEIALLRQFLEERSRWLYQVLIEEEPLSVETLDLSFQVVYGHPDHLIIEDALAWKPIEVSFETQQLSEADEYDYAWHRADVYLSSKTDEDFQTPSLTVNGDELSYEILEDGRLHFAVEYEDLSYRPAYYGDVDIGLIYNNDVYMELLPDVAAECDYEEDRMMEYFCTVGMEKHQCANRLFTPANLRNKIPELVEDCITWTDCYWALLDHGYEEGWLLKIQTTFNPELEDVL